MTLYQLARALAACSCGCDPMCESCEQLLAGFKQELLADMRFGLEDDVDEGQPL